MQALFGMAIGILGGLIVRGLDSQSALAVTATAIVGSVATLRGLVNAARLVVHTPAWLAITALIAVVIGTPAQL